MLQKGDRVLVGVSGGADSMLLLHFLLSVQKQWDLQLLAAHVEHGIRGAASVQDAEFVRRFCAEHHITYYQKRIDAPKEAQAAGLGVEEYSRNVRYAFFDSIDCDKIATAHNLSDNVETVLFRLSRGTSLKGMCGIPPVRGKIIRPLIQLSANTIRAYCAEQGIDYRVDSTNADTIYTRNYIRNVLIPDFEKLNPSFEQAVSRFIQSACMDEIYLEESADFALQLSQKPAGLDCEKLKTFSRSEVNRALLKYFEYYNISLDTQHLKAVCRLVFQSGREQLSGGFYAVSDGSFLSVKKAGSEEARKKAVYDVHVVSVKEFLNIRELSQIQIDFYCDYDKINGNVVFRPRGEGDRIAPAGRGCTKTLKKLLNEYRVPLTQRKAEIVITDAKGIIGVAGCCCDERVKLDKKTQSVYYIRRITQ